MARLSALVALALLLVTGCGTASTPEDAVRDLMRGLDEGDCRTVKDLVLTPSEVDCGVVENAEGTFSDEGIDLDQVTYTAGDVEDDSVTVMIDWGNGDPKEPYEAQRVDGKWLVVFDSTP